MCNIQGTLLYPLSNKWGIYKINDDWIYFGQKNYSDYSYHHINGKNLHSAVLKDGSTRIYFTCLASAVTFSPTSTNSKMNELLFDLVHDESMNVRRVILYLYIFTNLRRKLTPTVSQSEFKKMFCNFMKSHVCRKMYECVVINPGGETTCRCGSEFNAVFELGFKIPCFSGFHQKFENYKFNVFIGFLSDKKNHVSYLELFDQTGMFSCHVDIANKESNYSYYFHLCPYVVVLFPWKMKNGQFIMPKREFTNHVCTDEAAMTQPVELYRIIDFFSRHAELSCIQAVVIRVNSLSADFKEDLSLELSLLVDDGTCSAKAFASDRAACEVLSLSSEQWGDLERLVKRRGSFETTSYQQDMWVDPASFFFHNAIRQTVGKRFKFNVKLPVKSNIWERIKVAINNYPHSVNPKICFKVISATNIE